MFAMMSGFVCAVKVLVAVDGARIRVKCGQGCVSETYVCPYIMPGVGPRRLTIVTRDFASRLLGGQVVPLGLDRETRHRPASASRLAEVRLDEGVDCVAIVDVIRRG